MDRRCLTSGMVLHTKITPTGIIIQIDTPNQNWDGTTAEKIDDRLHDGIEYALAPFWKAHSENDNRRNCTTWNAPEEFTCQCCLNQCLESTNTV